MHFEKCAGSLLLIQLSSGLTRLALEQSASPCGADGTSGIAVLTLAVCLSMILENVPFTDFASAVTG